MYLKYTCLFGLVIPIVITVLISCTTTSGYSSTLENNTVLQAAQKSLDAYQKQLAPVSPEPVPNVVPSAIQQIHGTSFVKGVFFTWVIISSDNEVSVNLRYVGDGTTPPVSVATTALPGEGKSVTMKGNTDLNAGWTSPNSVVLFDPLNYKMPMANFQFKGTRSDTYTTYDFIFPIAIPK